MYLCTMAILGRFFLHNLHENWGRSTKVSFLDHSAYISLCSLGAETCTCRKLFLSSVFGENDGVDQRLLIATQAWRTGTKLHITAASRGALDINMVTKPNYLMTAVSYGPASKVRHPAPAV